MADLRRTLARADLADVALEGQVDAARFAAPSRRCVTAPVLDLKATPDDDALASQLIHGEPFDVLDVQGGLAWGQSAWDGYVGYVPDAGLGPEVPGVLRVTAISAPVYPRPHFKSVPAEALPWLAVVDGDADGAFLKVAGGYLCTQHVGAPVTDWVAEAARLLGMPYLWGGRSSFGLDCSALVQLALMAVGVTAPRDSDMQAAELGTLVTGPLRRGDLVFWKGHVGIMEDAVTLLHANVHHMCVAREPLADAEARIAGKGDGPVTARKRLALTLPRGDAGDAP